MKDVYQDIGIDHDVHVSKVNIDGIREIKS